MMSKPYRPEPALPVTAMQTYSLIRPVNDAFWEVVPCERVQCERHLKGWISQLDASTVEGSTWIRWIVNQAGRRFVKKRRGTIITFTFPAGQQCFEKHRRPRERDPLFIVRNGDHRGFTGEKRIHARGEDWRDDMAEVLDKVNAKKRRG